MIQGLLPFHRVEELGSGAEPHFHAEQSMVSGFFCATSFLQDQGRGFGVRRREREKWLSGGSHERSQGFGWQLLCTIQFRPRDGNE